MIKRKTIVEILLLLTVITLTTTSCMGYAVNSSGAVVPISSGNITIDGVGTEDGRLSTMSKSYFVGVAEGDIVGHTTWAKMGYHPATTALQTTVWDVGTQYVFPLAAQGMEVRSSSVEDDPLKADGITPGTGIYSIKIWYLTNAFVEKTETITLNGTANVNTVNTDIYRINYMQMVTSGTSKAAVGSVDIRNKTDHTTIYSRITTGFTRARSTVYTVPASKTLYITDVTLSAAYSSAGKAVRITGQTTHSDLENINLSFFVPFMEVMLVDNVCTKQFTIPDKFIGSTDLKFSVQGEANAQITIVLRGWLE